MKKRVNSSLISKIRSYTYDEIAKRLGISKYTVRQWKKDGLKVLTETKPYIINGLELKTFLEKRRKSFKSKLDKNEFYCLSCRTGRTSINNEIMVIYTGKLLGKDTKELYLKGKCPVCGKTLCRLSSEKYINEVKDNFKVQEIKYAK